MQRNAGDQTTPKAVIEWTDVEDETRKLDSYSLKVRPPFVPSAALIDHVASRFRDRERHQWLL